MNYEDSGQQEQESQYPDMKSMLPDENNTDPIMLTAEDGSEYEFAQVAVIPLDEKVYCILKPLSQMDGVESDVEAFVMELGENTDTGEDCLYMVVDDDVIDRVFNGYYSLLRKEGIISGESDPE